MPASPPIPTPEATPQVPATIGFRLEEGIGQALALRAAMLGVSPHKLAQHYVELALQVEENLDAIGLALAQLRELHRQLRDDVASAAVALLVAAGNVGEEEARAWADENLKHS